MIKAFPKKGREGKKSSAQGSSADQEQEFQNRQKKVSVVVKRAQLRLTEIAEPDYDTPDCAKYLENISESNLVFANIKFASSEGLLISEADLSLKKHNTMRLTLSEASKLKEDKIITSEICKLKNLFISFSK